MKLETILTKRQLEMFMLLAQGYSQSEIAKRLNVSVANVSFDFIQQRGYGIKARAFADDEHLTSLVIQGEFCAPHIQRNRLKLNSPEWYVFTVIENGKRSDLHRMLHICKILGLAHVPVEETGSDLHAKYSDIDTLLKRAEGDYPCGGKKEGIVIRPVVPIMSKSLNDWLSFKVINNSFLLKNEE